MKYKIAFVAMVAFVSATICRAQNFSGLQYKKLNKVDDLGASLESLFSRLGGKIDGSVDSVIVLAESEKEMRVKIYYSGFTNCFFTVSTMDNNRQREQAVSNAKFSQTGTSSEAECVLKLANDVPADALPESPFLRIDIAKKDGNSGKVKIFELRKKWLTKIPAQNILINVVLQPVGVAASLKNTEQKDVMPTKKILFDPKANFNKSQYYNPKLRTMKPAGGGNSYHPPFGYEENNDADLSGTWNNTDANTTGLTKFIITGNQIQVFYKCSPNDCELGKAAMAGSGPVYKVNFSNSIKKTEITLQLAGADLKVTSKERTGPFGSVTRMYSYTFKKNVYIKYVSPKIFTLSEYAILQPAGTGPVSKEPLGPDKDRQINLWNDLVVDNQVNFDRPQEISNINMSVFADKNPNSGIYYIIPADYHLRWEAPAMPKQPESGYSFNILYGSQLPGGDEPGATDAPVRMSAKLTAGISNTERNFIKAMMKAIKSDFVDIRYLPLSENMETTFQNTLTAQFGVPADKITVTSSTDLNNDITIAWRTNADTKEFIQTALTSREGISASVMLKPKDDGIVDQLLPATINLADNRSLGKMSLTPTTWRTTNWRNPTPYPLQLKYLHVLKKEIAGNRMVIYSWSMNNVEVPSQAQVAFDNSKVPAWLDTDPTVMMWLDYSVSDCPDCDQRVMEEVTGGVFGNTTQQIKFTIAPAVFDTLNASYFMIYVRSLQGDPKGETMKELEAVKITSDGEKEFTTGPLFISPGGQPDFEYKITVASKDGDFYPSAQWIRASEKEVLLGKTAMKELFKNIIPGLN